MENNPNAKLLRIFTGENDKLGWQPLYEQSKSGGLITLEKAEAIRYKAGK